MPAQNQSVLEIERVKRLRLSNTILIFSSLIAVGFTVVALKQDAGLKRENAAIRSELQRVPHSIRGDIRAQVGDLVASFGASNTSGKRTKVVYNGKSSYLLFFFSPECGSCVSEFPAWNKIAPQAQAKKYTVLGVSTDTPEATSAKVRALSFQVVSIEDDAVLRAYRLERIPMVMLTSPYGRVEWLNYGPLTEDKINELLSKLAVVQANATD